MILKSEDVESAIEWEGNEIPVQSIQIETPQRNFHRRVTVYGKPTADAEWRRLRQDTISNYQLENFKESDLVIYLSSEPRMKHYRLEIADNENRPVAIEKIIMSGPQYQAIWLAAENSTYDAVFISKPPKNQDRKALEILLDEGFPITTAQWGSDLRKNSTFTPRPPSRFAFLNDPRILWGAIGVAVASLLLLLFGAARKIDRLPD